MKGIYSVFFLLFPFPLVSFFRISHTPSSELGERKREEIFTKKGGKCKSVPWAMFYFFLKWGGGLRCLVFIDFFIM